MSVGLLNKHFELSGSWFQKYDDEGQWYGSDYFDSTEADFSSFYGIDTKTDDYGFLLFTRFIFDNWSINTGASFRDVVDRNLIKSNSYVDYGMVTPE